MTDRFQQFLNTESLSLSRRHFLTTSAAIASGLVLTPIGGSALAAATPLKEVRFSEAVHNLGYINLYVGMHSGIFEKNGLDMKVTAAGGDTQTFAAVLGGSQGFANRDVTQEPPSREAGRRTVAGGTL